MKVDILGTSFTLQSDEDPEYLATVTNFFASKVEEIRKSVDTSDPVKLAILAGILVVDELFKEKGTSSSYHAPSPTVDSTTADGNESRLPFSSPELEEAERITLELIERIDTTLEAAAFQKYDESE